MGPSLKAKGDIVLSRRHFSQMGKKSVVLHTEWFDIEEESYEDLSFLNSKPFYRMTSPDGALVLAFTGKEEVILVRQFRPALNNYTLELPSGSVGAGESPKDAAVRELYEETGYRCADMKILGAGRIMMNRNSSREFAFFGSGASKDAGFKPHEDIEVVLVPATDFKTLVLTGQFEQLAGLALWTLADWKLGTHLCAR